MKIIAIPLDIRPYNYDFLHSLAQMDSSVTLSLPAKACLGFKKQPADRDALETFINSGIADGDALIVSLDMYIYGGLFPSRVHHEGLPALLGRLDSLRRVKQRRPSLRIYASSLVLRTPKYNSAEEEPDYYATCGEAIFGYGYLDNKQQRQTLSKEEQAQLALYRQAIPDEALEDWLSRREKNRQVIKAAIGLVAEGVLEQLVIPLDDTAEYGFTASDQLIIYQWIREAGVQERVYVHPGTDESGCTLLTRAWLDHRGQPFAINTLCSSDAFWRLVPNYEDRPFYDSLCSHAAACGITLSYDDSRAPLLAINGCGEIMQEACATSYGYCVHRGRKIMPYKDISYSTRRTLAAFVADLTYRAQFVPVVVADLAFSNGGETELIELLDRFGALDRLQGYAGWNTTCNSLGTALATLAFSSLGDNPAAVRNFLQERLMSDWAWQTEARFPIQCEFVPALGASYADFEAVADTVFAEIEHRLYAVWRRHIRRGFGGKIPAIVHLSAPFKRLSGLQIKVSEPPL